MEEEGKIETKIHTTSEALEKDTTTNNERDAETIEKIMNTDLEKYYGNPIKVKNSYSNFIIDYKEQEQRKQIELDASHKNNIDVTTNQLNPNNEASHISIVELNGKNTKQNNDKNKQANNGFYAKSKNWIGGVWTKMKNVNWNPFKAQEVECIDAHGHKYKRPVKKIPLRKKKPQTQDEKNIRFTADLGMYYASNQTTGIGTFFI